MIDATNPTLLASGTKYRSVLLATPMLKISDVYGETLTRRIGVRGKEIVGRIKSSAGIRPYQTAKGATDSTGITFREIETFLGDVVEEFDPHPIAKTIYGNAIGTLPENFDIAKAVAVAMAASVGELLVNSIFSAVRKASGTTTADLFDGFYTQIAKAITAADISADKKNLIEVDKITSVNACDVLKSIFLKADQKLVRRGNINMYVPFDVMNAYNECYLAEHGSVSYNKEFEQSVLVGSNGRCKLVPVFDETPNAPIILTHRENMIIGCDQVSDEEKVEIRRGDNPKVVQFFMKMFFGVQIGDVTSEFLMVGKQVAPAADPAA